MRVLMTTDTVGGVWTFTQELCEGLLAAGAEVCLVSFGRAPDAGQLGWVEQVGIRYVPTEIPLEWMAGNASAYSVAEGLLVRLVGEFGADLVHANQFCFGALPVSVAKVVTAHSDVLSWGRVCRPEGLEDSEWLRTYVRLVQDGLAGADVVVAPTAWMLGAMGEGFMLPREQRVVWNGRTVGAESTPHGETGERMLRAVTAGRLWDEGKGVAMLREVVSPVPLVLVGEKSFGEVQGAGVLGERDLLELFHGSALYICTSVYEPFGLAPLEAALCGCAVLARDIASLREVWRDGALYFSDAETLSGLLHWLAGDAEALAEAQRRSRERARQFTQARMTAGYLAVYEEVCERERAYAA